MVTPDFDPITGEIIERCPHCERADAEVEEITRKWKGELLKNRKLSKDKEAELWGHPDRPIVEMLHALHAAATKANADTPTRRKRLDPTELENTLVSLRTIGLRRCLEAVVGQTWDPSVSPRPGKNGKRDTYNQFELCFRTSAKADSFAERAPIGWEPDPGKVAAITGVPEEWVRRLFKESK